MKNSFLPLQHKSYHKCIKQADPKKKKKKNWNLCDKYKGHSVVYSTETMVIHSTDFFQKAYF